MKMLNNLMRATKINFVISKFGTNHQNKWDVADTKVWPKIKVQDPPVPNFEEDRASPIKFFDRYQTLVSHVRYFIGGQNLF